MRRLKWTFWPFLLHFWPFLFFLFFFISKNLVLYVKRQVVICVFMSHYVKHYGKYGDLFTVFLCSFIDFFRKNRFFCLFFQIRVNFSKPRFFFSKTQKWFNSNRSAEATYSYKCQKQSALWLPDQNQAKKRPKWRHFVPIGTLFYHCSQADLLI